MGGVGSAWLTSPPSRSARTRMDGWSSFRHCGSCDVFISGARLERVTNFKFQHSDPIMFSPSTLTKRAQKYTHFLRKLERAKFCYTFSGFVHGQERRGVQQVIEASLMCFVWSQDAVGGERPRWPQPSDPHVEIKHSSFYQQTTSHHFSSGLIQYFLFS